MLPLALFPLYVSRQGRAGANGRVVESPRTVFVGVVVVELVSRRRRVREEPVVKIVFRLVVGDEVAGRVVQADPGAEGRAALPVALDLIVADGVAAALLNDDPVESGAARLVVVPFTPLVVNR